jgi:hypothetical protein
MSDEFNFKLEDAWENIEMRAELRWQEDLRNPDLTWEEAKKLKMRYVDWHRRHEAHELHARGESRPPMRRFAKRFEEIRSAE